MYRHALAGACGDYYAIISVIAGAREGRPYVAMSTMGCDGCDLIP